MGSFFDRSRITAAGIIQQAVDKVTELYGQSQQVFTASSPFGQILMTISNLFEMFMTYLSHAEENLNIETATSPAGIYGLASLNGHNAFRGSSAKAVINIAANATASGIDGSYIRIQDGMTLSVPNSELKYFINAGKDSITINTKSSEGVNVEIIQGVVEEQVFVSDGSMLQSFDVITKKMTDHWKVDVYVNDEKWNKKESLYDMNEGEESYILKTGMTAGLTVFFGNGNFGKIPTAGAVIRVKYVLTDGAVGNMDLSTVEFTFDGQGVSSKGEEIDLNENLSVRVLENARSGSDYEDLNFTKLIAPKTSRSFVLATADNYRSYLMRYDDYSFVDVNVTKEGYRDDAGIVYITLLKNIDGYYSEGYDYFTVPEERMLPKPDEIDNIKSLIINSGYSVVNTNIVIDSLIIEHYIINILVRAFDTADKNSVRSTIYDKLNTYYKNIRRRDIIARSDIISIVESVEGVDTCQVFFIYERNEDAKKNGYYTDYTREYDTINDVYGIVKKIIKVEQGTDPRIGFDEMDNLIVPDGIVLIPRGGWKDANGNKFDTTYNPDTLSNLNIFFTDDVPSDVYSSDTDKKLNAILKEMYK